MADKPKWRNLSENFLSVVAHVTLIGPAIYIIILASGLSSTLFLWHPTCMVVGCGMLMTEAVLSISGDAIVTLRFSRSCRITIHTVLHVIGIALLTVGFGAIVANKINNNASHFTSDHGKIGLTTFIVSILVAIGGSLLVLPKVRLGVKPAIIKLFHACFGSIAIILLIAALITGLYRPWRPYTELGRVLMVASYVIGAVIILVRPIYGTLERFRALLT